MRSIKEPIPAIGEVCRHLSAATDAHLSGDFSGAAAHFLAADCPQVWAWVNPAWGRPDLHVKIKAPPGDSRHIAKDQRDPDRMINPAVRSAVLARDGYRCRYCGIPVVDAAIRKIVRQLYPDQIRWANGDPKGQHAGFQCLWLQYDHVVPHSHGGRSSEDNVVISCALCNFGKDRYTLLQLGLSDPRLRPPEAIEWDGLERLRQAVLPPAPRKSKNLSSKTRVQAARLGIPHGLQAFFLPGAWISKGYVYTPQIAGKERWFKIGDEVAAKPVTRGDQSGVQLICKSQALQRRGIDPTGFRDDGALVLPSCAPVGQGRKVERDVQQDLPAGSRSDTVSVVRVSDVGQLHAALGIGTASKGMR